MERLAIAFRENPQLTSVTLASAFVILLLGFFTFLLVKAGVSVRPIIWFAGFLFIIGGPQAIVHLLDGLVIRKWSEVARKDSQVLPVPLSHAAPAPAPFNPIPWAEVFGPHADPRMITDAKQSLAPILHEAEEAKLSFTENLQTALAARFPDEAAAAKARDTYGSFFVLSGAEGSDVDGWTARRHTGQGEWVHLVTAGRELYAWTAQTREEVLENRVRALGEMRTKPDHSSGADSAKPNLVSTRLVRRGPLMFAIVGLNVLAAAFWFFKGTAWVSRVDAKPAVPVMVERELRSRLEHTSFGGLPINVSTMENGDIEVTWRYADARWFDLTRLHQIKKVERLVLHLDEAQRTVRVREYWSTFDASAGPGNLRLNWTMQTGIQFFAREHTRTFGAQLNQTGQLTGELSNAYSLDLRRLKDPLIAEITNAGWHWQPLVWNAPASLRWFTE